MLLSRRQLLVGGASALAVAACGSSGKGATPTTAKAGRQLYNAFDPSQPVGKPLRLPLGVVEGDGSFTSNIPRSLSIVLARPDGSTTAPIEVARHQQDLPRGYYPLATTLDVPGRWTIATVLDGHRVTTLIDAKPANELPAIPGPGDLLPKVPTPTPADHQGVDPICTRDPVCPFHTTSLDKLIGGTKPIALLVSTPAHCQVAICGPVLDVLLSRKAKLEAAGVEVVHAEVYVDNDAKQTAPTVNALGLTFEPALFLARGDGTVVERLDYIYDTGELDAVVAKLS